MKDIVIYHHGLSHRVYNHLLNVHVGDEQITKIKNGVLEIMKYTICSHKNYRKLSGRLLFPQKLLTQIENDVVDFEEELKLYRNINRLPLEFYQRICSKMTNVYDLYIANDQLDELHQMLQQSLPVSENKWGPCFHVIQTVYSIIPG